MALNTGVLTSNRTADGEKFWWSKDKFGTTDVYDDRQG